MSIAIVAALPREVAALVKGWERHEMARNVCVWTRSDVVVACAGMGALRAALACEAAMKVSDITTLLSAGVAGACDPKLQAGDIVWAGVVIDARTGERFEAEGGAEIVVTGAGIAGVNEKARLRAAYDAAAVEMEAAAVARIAMAHGLRFRAVKAISDEAEFEMEQMGRFAAADGQFRAGAFALHTALRPWQWSGLITLARSGPRAIHSLTAALRAEID